jgi:hypothetical protein
MSINASKYQSKQNAKVPILAEKSKKARIEKNGKKEIRCGSKLFPKQYNIICMLIFCVTIMIMGK